MCLSRGKPATAFYWMLQTAQKYLTMSIPHTEFPFLSRTWNTSSFLQKARNQDKDNSLLLEAAKCWLMIQLFYYELCSYTTLNFI
jgi:hypothetical protein